MKQSDIFSLILIAGIGTIAAFFICRGIMGNPDNATVTFKALTRPVEMGLADPDPEVFNSGAINPTIEVYVGNCEDIDRNGILDNGELQACGQVPRDPVTCEDLNGDNMLTPKELESCGLNFYGSYVSCDKDKNGFLDATERFECNIFLPGEEMSVGE